MRPSSRSSRYSQALAALIGAVPGQELDLDSRDLGLHLLVLGRVQREQLAGQRRQGLVGLDAQEQRRHVREARRAREAELGGVAADRVRELGAVADQAI